VRERTADGSLPSDTKLRSSKYLNNLIEQDHRGVKQRIRGDAVLQGVQGCGDHDRRHRADAPHPQGTVRTGPWVARSELRLPENLHQSRRELLLFSSCRPAAVGGTIGQEDDRVRQGVESGTLTWECSRWS
jgi:hypothetical protein